ncbi:MAG: PIN/TRAM domain-containing protein [Methylocystaceae bacterium]
MAKTKRIFVSPGLLLASISIAAWSGYNLMLLLPQRNLLVLGLSGSAAIVLYLIGFGLYKRVKRVWSQVWGDLDNVSPEVLLTSLIGVLVGGLFGLCLGGPLLRFGTLGVLLTLSLIIVGGGIGNRIGRRRGKDVVNWIRELPTQTMGAQLMPKVLDTSAIIDGRIYDICLSRFLEGRIVVPSFVIEELRHIADSSDYLRRSKGRRGLDILNKMQKTNNIFIEIWEGDFPEEREVDMKLLRLCRELLASIVTNDYNLNKVAELQGIQVLNVNELANAVKVMVFPGESMRVSIVKEGKEQGQGIGYLEDGTMVVVENGEQEIGTQIDVMVTSVFQTAAGRMIFTRRLRDRENGQVEVNMVG